MLWVIVLAVVAGSLFLVFFVGALVYRWVSGQGVARPETWKEAAEGALEATGNLMEPLVNADWPADP
jgi:hypothetical protein